MNNSYNESVNNIRKIACQKVRSRFDIKGKGVINAETSPVYYTEWNDFIKRHTKAHVIVKNKSNGRCIVVQLPVGKDGYYYGGTGSELYGEKVTGSPQYFYPITANTAKCIIAG